MYFYLERDVISEYKNSSVSVIWNRFSVSGSGFGFDVPGVRVDEVFTYFKALSHLGLINLT